jgi:hypothetical protein
LTFSAMPVGQSGASSATEKRDPSKWLENQEDWFSEKMQPQVQAQNKCKILEVKPRSIKLCDSMCRHAAVSKNSQIILKSSLAYSIPKTVSLSLSLSLSFSKKKY